MKTNETYMTKQMMQFCYTCEDAMHCTTEAKCQACWEEKTDRMDREEGTLETKRLLQLYYA